MMESEPLLLENADRLTRALHYTTAVSVALVSLLAASTITLAILYTNSQRSSEDGSNQLPKWPDPSLSPLGKYTDAAVAADNGYCSEIGRDILLRGGNAVDSAIATLFCIGVMDSHSSGLGGGHFMTVYNATTRRCHVIDARETAPAKATEMMFINDSMASRRGWRAVAVPGELHGLRTAYERLGGALKWESLLSPSIELLRQGYPTSNALARALRLKRRMLLKQSTMNIYINPETGHLFRAGQLMKTRQTLADTLTLLAKSGDPIAEFYKGPLSKSMAEEFRRNGGLITETDLANYRSIVRNDSQVIYTKLSSDRVICGPPPPSGSAVAQAILNILDGYKMDQSTLDTNVDIFHRFIEASKFAYADRSELGDMDFVSHSFPIAKNITSHRYARYIQSRITEKTHDDSYYGGEFYGTKADHGTTHITVMDKYGNAVAATSTINLYFGAMRRSVSTGVIWNDEMDDFSTPGHPNAFGYPPSPANFIHKGKRPQSSMSPIVIFNVKTGRPELAVGGAGGSTIISGTATVALHALWLNWNLKAAVDAPRLHNQLKPNYTKFESLFPREYIAALKYRGHLMKKVGNLTVVTAIEHSADSSTYANSDFRKGTESYTAGY